MNVQKTLKVLKIIHIVGYGALFVAMVFSLVNKIANKLIFNEFVLFPLLIVGIAGIVTGFIYLAKLPTEDEKKNESDKND